jgi:hypothetical protein
MQKQPNHKPLRAMEALRFSIIFKGYELVRLKPIEFEGFKRPVSNT